jgi:sodium/proline symporter
MSLFWKRTNIQGALAGIISGAAVVILWDYIPLSAGQTLSASTGLYSLIPGFIISLLLIIIVSLATPEPKQDIVEAFEDVNRK